MSAIYKKELRAYFNSMIGWLFIAFFLVFVGIYFFLYNLYSGYTDFGYTLSAITSFFVLLIPMVTMRLIAEENKQKTDQLLLTSPVSIEKIILGKYLATVTVFSIAILICCTYPLIMSLFGEINMIMTYSSILAFFLLGCTYLAIGMFISALTESQAFAAVVTFIVVFLTCLMDGIASLFSSSAKTAWFVFAFLLLLVAIITWLTMKSKAVTRGFLLISQVAIAGVYFLNPTLLEGAIVKVFHWFSVISRYDDFVNGIFNVSSIVYYISMIVLFYFLTVQVIKKRRWN